jgi:hypothetical protein
MIDRHEILELKERNPVDVILKELGSRPVQTDDDSLVFKSPFGDETVPGFRVDVDKAPGGRFTDALTGRTGDVIDLICALRNCSFIEAVAILRQRGR